MSNLKGQFYFLLRSTFILLVNLFLLSSIAAAATVTWIGGSSSVMLWSDATKWDTGTVPSSGDDVILPDLGTSYQVSCISTVNINSLTITGGDKSTPENYNYSRLFVYNAGSLTVQNAFDIGTGGQLAGSAPITAIGPVNIASGGSFSGVISTTIQDTLSSEGSLTLGGDVILNGTIQGTSLVSFDSGTNLSGNGELNLTSPGYLMIRYDLTVSGNLTNSGDVKFYNASEISISFSDSLFTNDGLFSTAYSNSPINFISAPGSDFHQFTNNGTFEAGIYFVGPFDVGINFINNDQGVVTGQNIKFSSFFTNNAGGIIRGRGPFDFSTATVLNNGVLDPYYSTDQTTTLSITGDFPFHASSSTLIEIEADGNDDKIAISGNATLGGTLDVTQLVPSLVLGTTYEILSASSVSGTFDTVSFPPPSNGRQLYLHYNPTSVIVEVGVEGATFSDLSVTLDGSGTGAVTSTPTGIDCGSTCTDIFSSADEVTLTATADAGSVFWGWSGDADCSDGILTMDADKSCIASFELDTDGDGLVDIIEEALGTNSNSQDSDNDGLSDYYEVNIDGDPTSYTAGVDTDPTNPDTDGDGDLDGAENCFGGAPLNASFMVPSTIRISNDSLGGQSNQNSYDFISITSNGRYIAFQSYANNLITEDDTNIRPDIFLKDTITGTTTRISTDSNGVEANQTSSNPDLSADGRYLVFESGATNFIENDTNGGISDIFRKDLQTGQVTVVSTDSNGNQATDGCEEPSISGDGRYVVYRAFANILPEDTSEFLDIYLKDTNTGVTTLVSANVNGIVGDDDSTESSISGNGNFIVFSSWASNLVTGVTNDTDDIYIRNRITGEITRISTDSSGVESNGESQYPAISDDGRYVAFRSAATNLVPGDNNGFRDVFLKDTQTGLTTRVSTDGVGQESNGDSYYVSISGDGRYVVFESEASNLVEGDTNNARDIFIKDTQTGNISLITRNSGAVQGNGSSEAPVISSDGEYITFVSSATNLVYDTNGYDDIFRVDNPFFASTYYSLTLSLEGTGSGSVTSLPSGIDCGSTCSSSFIEGTMVTFIPVADVGSIFVSWSGDGDCSDGIVSVRSNVSCSAEFGMDSDSDGVADSQDVCPGYNDFYDADNDQVPDCIDTGDTDGDGFTDAQEVDCTSDPADPQSKCNRGMPWLLLLLEDD